jgi:UDP-N-acetylglucosamine 2-epimerase (non-hydrolysing)
VIIFSYGTRPEFIKVDPIIQEFKKRSLPYKVLFTGQHLDLIKDQEIDYQFSLDQLGCHNRLNQVLLNIMKQFEDLPLEDVSGVLVQGDTTSALAVGMAAFHHKIPVIHLEAGLRTYDIFSPYPEEYNRRSLSSLASLHLCPTINGEKNLLNEGVSKGVFVVGNSVLDNLIDTKVTTNNKIIVTLHRREKHHEIKEWFKAVDKLAIKYPQYDFVLPAHPNPEVQKYLNVLTKVTVREPFEHKDFVEELASCYAVVTDSGGIQEEAAFLGKPCVVCRDFTERSEGIGTHALLCESYDKLDKIFTKTLNLKLNEVDCPYGDGKTGKRVTDILLEHFNLLEGEK